MTWLAAMAGPSFAPGAAAHNAVARTPKESSRPQSFELAAGERDGLAALTGCGRELGAAMWPDRSPVWAHRLGRGLHVHWQDQVVLA